MGLAFYGRTFSMTSEACNTPGCTYESGGQRGKCSREVGILLNSEIDDLVKQNSVTPTLYKKETAKVATWGNQWVAYDDAETLQIKSEYAQTRCLGGLMVWAISHDTQDAKYHKALAKAANRKITSLPATDGSDDAFKYLEVDSPQCKWTNCGESCPSGWAHIKRSDPQGKKDEYMYDETSCGPSGVHKFCCPPALSLPECGWYTQKNGNCDSTCPGGTVEIGSYNANCKKAGTYQSACCSSNHKSMRLYTNGEWGAYPLCEETSTCPATDSKKTDLLAKSNSGTGGSPCNVYYRGHILPKDPPEERKYCYDSSDKKERFSDCAWFSGIGIILSGAPKDWCLSGCPSNRVRIGMAYGDGCAQSSMKALCCLPHATETVQEENPILDEYRDALEEYVKDPKCGNLGFATRDSHALWNRAEKNSIKTVQALALALIVQTASNSLLDMLTEIWNKAMEDYTNLQFPILRNYIKSTEAYRAQGPIQVSWGIVCSPNYWNTLASKTEEKKLVCIDSVCNHQSCTLPDLNSRSQSPVRPYKHSHHHLIHRADHATRKIVERSGSKRDIVVSLPGGQITITLPRYPQNDDFPQDHTIKDEAVDFVSRGDCTQTQVQHFILRTGETFEVEHAFDGNVMRLFIQDAAAGRLRSGAVAQTGAVSASFFREVRRMPVNVGAPPLPGGEDYIGLFDRVMECAGSMSNRGNFVFAHKDINYAKSQIMRGRNPVSDKNVLTQSSDPTLDNTLNLLTNLRASIGVIHYLNYQGTPNVNQRLTNIVNDMGDQWNHGQAVWNAANPQNPTTVGDFWSEWLQDYYP